MSDTSNYNSFRNSYDFSQPISADLANIAGMMRRVWTTTIVLVKSCTNMGTVKGVGFVNVQPMISQLDPQGKPTEHDQIYQLPYFRLQGGNNGQNNNTNAIIIDPQPGDIGAALFVSRDISNVVKNKKVSNPGSNRQFDPADGLYLGGYLNAVPNQYIQFVQPTDDNNNVQGINIVDFYGNMIQMGQAGITITDTNGNVIMMSQNGIQLQDCNNQVINMESGQISMTTNLLAVSGNITSNGKHAGYTHTHGSVQSGTGTSGPPNN